MRAIAAGAAGCCPSTISREIGRNAQPGRCRPHAVRARRRAQAQPRLRRLRPRARLDAVVAELNARPRKTLGWETPAERLTKLLAPGN
jgi:IS30 family transposase